MIIDYGNWTLDVNVILMINVCKISAIAFSYYDSDRDEKKCTDYMLRHKLDRVPNILEYFSYIYFIPSCIVGPFFEYKDYENFMYKKGDYANEYEKIIPNKFPVVFKKFLLAILFAVFLIISENISNTDIILDETGKYSDLRIFFAVILSYTIKYRYYVGWLFTESMFALTGLGFQITKQKSHISKNTEDKENISEEKDIANYERVKNLDYEQMEFNPSPSNVFKYWNMMVGIWLKRYVRDRFIFYENLQPTNLRKNISYLLTFMISAFWHGFYPSYYISFTHFPFMIMLYHNYEKINKIYKITEKVPKYLVNFLYYASVVFLMNMTSMIFCTLEYHKVVLIMQKTKYLFTIYIFGGWLVTQIILKFSVMPEEEKKENKTIKKE